MAEAVEGDVWVDDLDLWDAAGDEGGVAAGGDDLWGSAEFVAELGEDFFDEATVAEDGAGLHGVGGGLADGGGWLGEFDFWEECGFLGEVAGHGAETRGDDAAGVGWGGGDDVEGDGGAEVDDDGGEAVAGDDSGGVGEAIGADL